MIVHPDAWFCAAPARLLSTAPGRQAYNGKAYGASIRCKMVRMQGITTAVALLLVFTLLAGCSGKGSEIDDDNFGADELGLKATLETGVIRGVVVDDAIRPVAGVEITIRSGDFEKTQVTGDDGLFGFQDLAPGDYFVSGSKHGYIAAQTQVSVVANMAQPPLVRLLLEVDLANLPYVQVYKFEGFIECSESFIAVGHATCSELPDSNDEFSAEYVLDRPPTWAQSEMIWESSQSVSTELSMLWSRSLPSQTLLDNWAEASGESPQVIMVNETRAAEVGLGSNITLLLRVFNQHNEGTSPDDIAPDPRDGDECYERPQLGGCLRGVGVTFQQSFTVYTHVFYGYAPSDGWLFHVDGDAPGPAS